jgi:hypothetical protein
MEAFEQVADNRRRGPPETKLFVFFARFFAVFAVSWRSGDAHERVAAADSF